MAKMGAPEKIDAKKLASFMRLKPTMEDCAHFFECSPSAIEKFIKRHYKMTYSDFRDKNMVHTRFSLVRTALERANKGDNVMLIFCLKNLCGWKDKQEHSLDDERPIKLAYVTNPKREI